MLKQRKEEINLKHKQNKTTYHCYINRDKKVLLSYCAYKGSKVIDNGNGYSDSGHTPLQYLLIIYLFFSQYLCRNSLSMFKSN